MKLAAAIAVILAAYAIRRLFTEPPIVPLPSSVLDDIDWLQEFREAERRLVDDDWDPRVSSPHGFGY
jgi:hypothetical protein